jgi:hypothetical protein
MVSKALKSRYRSKRPPDCVKSTNPDAPCQLWAEEDWSKQGAIWGGVVRLSRSIAGTCKTWLAPLIITIVIFAALFFFVGGSIDIPFLYRSAK